MRTKITSLVFLYDSVIAHSFNFVAQFVLVEYFANSKSRIHKVGAR